MSTFKKLLLLAALSLMATPAVSHADPYFTGVINQYKYTNLENVLDSNGNIVTGTPMVGDRFVGVIWATTDQSTAGSINFVPSGGSPAPYQITGVFDLTINSVVSGPNGNDFLLVPTAQGTPGDPLNGLGLPTNTMVALYTQNGSPFLGTGSNNGQLYTDSSLSKVYADASSGSLFGAYGYGSGYNSVTFGVADAGAANIGYWYSTTDGSVYNDGLTMLASALFPAAQGVFNGNLNLGTSNIPSGSQIANNKSGGTTTFDLAGSGSNAANSIAGGVTPIRTDLFGIQSQDPQRFDPLPEPSTLTLFGIGLSIFAVTRLRRGKKVIAN